jgi:hydroxymethylpyrimidine/phosphomethylpyrimidine kinase
MDLLYDGKKFYEYPTPRLSIGNVRGTGCIFSAALASRIALGKQIPEAVALAKKFTLKCISSSQQVGKGARQVLLF